MKQFILIILVLLPVCVFAQFTETFDGPEIDSNNPWVDDSSKYVINNGQLQFNGANLVGFYPFHLPLFYASKMEWEIDVSFSFRPTNFNNVRFCVYRTGKPDDIIFYVQVGSNNDDVSFRKWFRNNKTAPLITGKRSIGGKPVSIKLVMEEYCHWTLYTKLIGECCYTKEGECQLDDLPNILEEGSLNIISYCKAGSYDSDRYIYFDNISVRHEITDTPLAPEENPVDPDEEQPSETEIPSLLSLEEDESNSLLLTFDMPVNASSASIVLSGKEADTLYQSSDGTVLRSAWIQERKKSESYSLSYSGIYSKGGKEDCRGNKTFLSSLGGEDAKPEIPEEEPGSIPVGSILINEVMAKPGDDPFFEYVELYNSADSYVTLNGCVLWNGNKHKVLPDVVLPPNGYGLLYNSKFTYKGEGVAIPIEKFYALNDGGKKLVLKSSDGAIIDEYEYPKATLAKSWERSDSGDWHLSSDPRGGTPGSVNSSGVEEPDKPNKPEEPVEPDNPNNPDEPSIIVEPGEFIFNELLPNPFAGGAEYIELYNRSDRSLPVSGLSVAVCKTDGTLNTRYPLSSITSMIEPDGYALLTKNLSGVTDFYMIQSPSSLFEIPKLPILANTSSTLVLFRTKDETVIDEISYSSKWHAPSVKDQKGVALERIDPEAETQSAANWTSASATAGYGTPGYRNSQSDASSPDEPDKPTGIEAPEWVPGSEHYKITYYLDQPGYSCRAFVFNIAGQRVAEIANHELLGLSGELTWDGSSSVGRKLPTGVYIFYVELYHVSGQMKTYKKVFLAK